MSTQSGITTDPLGPDGPFVDPLGSAAPAGENEPLLAEVGSSEHRAALEEIYGPNHDSWEAFEGRAEALGVSVEDYAFGVREARLEVLEANAPPEAPPEGYPHLDYLTDMSARPWSDEDWERDRLRAERAAAPKELGGGDILSLANFDRDTWRAYVEGGVDPVATMARAEREQRQEQAEAHRAQALAFAQESRQRQLAAERDRAEQNRATRELIEREERRRGKSTVAALQAMGQLPRLIR